MNQVTSCSSSCSLIAEPYLGALSGFHQGCPQCDELVSGIKPELALVGGTKSKPNVIFVKLAAQNPGPTGCWRHKVQAQRDFCEWSVG